jgi:hypothetical protein
LRNDVIEKPGAQPDLPIAEEILAYHQTLLADPHDRFRSWEHCYRHFLGNPRDFDLASLHLAFYLASWGMYRGSSFLLQKDYRVHREVVKELLKPQHAKLRNLGFEDFAGGTEIMDALFDLLTWIKGWYRDNTPARRGPANVTDTLATKILMGTLGCTPAYDRFFVDGLKSRSLSFSYLNKTNFSQMIRFCARHRDAFEMAQKEVSAYGLQYPLMKIIDMYFWRLGWALAKAKSEEAMPD